MGRIPLVLAMAMATFTQFAITLSTDQAYAGNHNQASEPLRGNPGLERGDRGDAASKCVTPKIKGRSARRQGVLSGRLVGSLSRAAS